MGFKDNNNEKDNDNQRKLVHLLPRSLLIILDDARHVYAHSITGRMTDDIDNGKVTPMSTRHSLAFYIELDYDGMPMLSCQK